VEKKKHVTNGTAISSTSGRLSKLMTVAWLRTDDAGIVIFENHQATIIAIFIPTDNAAEDDKLGAGVLFFIRVPYRLGKCR
jgi:hypothetical protein